jgi:hypothetical protein
MNAILRYDLKIVTFYFKDTFYMFFVPWFFIFSSPRIDQSNVHCLVFLLIKTQNPLTMYWNNSI